MGIHRDINEMYQTSLGRIDQEHQTNPKGRAEIHARDEVASFYAANTANGL